MARGKRWTLAIALFLGIVRPVSVDAETFAPLMRVRSGDRALAALIDQATE